MNVHFWGTRGSLPAPCTAAMVGEKIFRALRAAQGHVFPSDDAIRAFIRTELPFNVGGTYGTNTPCVQIGGGDGYVVCDAGTGIRDFGTSVLAQGRSPQVYHLFLSHSHWDHIQGFPFFVPAYIPGNRIHIYGCHRDLRAAFDHQQQPLSFPVPLNEMGAEITFHTLEPGKTHRIAGLDVTPMGQWHPGGSFGYSFVKGGKKVVYSTDSEHRENLAEGSYPFLEFFGAADLLIFDAQYTLLDSMDTKENWGHSSNLVGVELAVRSGVKRLCLFHMEPTCGDDFLQTTLQQTRDYLEIYSGGHHAMEIVMAYDGLEIDL